MDEYGRNTITITNMITYIISSICHSCRLCNSVDRKPIVTLRYFVHIFLYRLFLIFGKIKSIDWLIE